jgi:hypothetical protein
MEDGFFSATFMAECNMIYMPFLEYQPHRYEPFDYPPTE